MLANTPCPINDARTGRLLMGKKAIDKYREDPATFVVGYEEDQEFWDTLLRVGEEYEEDEEIVVEDNTSKLSISDRFRSSKRNKSTSNSATTSSNAGTGDSGS
jgi:hypothetical protein